MRKTLYWIVIVSAGLLGLTLFISGIAKLPEQTEFADALLKSFWTPNTAYFISNVFPWIEACLGILLLLGIFQRMAAVFCIPVILGFITNNIWAISHGINEYSTCANCFGVLENYMGHLSPVGALIIDIVLLCLAIVIVIFDKKGFFSLQPWFIRQKNKDNRYEITSA